MLWPSPLLSVAGRGLPGMQVTFFCFAKRKSPKKRRPCCLRPLRCAPGQPAVLGSGGVSLELATLHFAQTIAIPDPPDPALLGADRRGNRERGLKTNTNSNTNKDTPWRVLVSSGVRYSSPTPLCMRRGAEVQTDQGKNLFERSELFLTPAGPSTAGCPQRSEGTQEPGSPFFCLLFFGEAKKSESPAGRPRPTTLSKEPPPSEQTATRRQAPPARSAAFPPAAVVFTVTACSAQKRYR